MRWWSLLVLLLIIFISVAINVSRQWRNIVKLGRNHSKTVGNYYFRLETNETSEVIATNSSTQCHNDISFKTTAATTATAAMI
jgi:hypothetical protein